MKIEAVVVCVNYDDFLEQTLTENLHHLDDIVVVTKKSDQKTLDVCRRHGVRALTTEVFHENGDKFNKGRAINYGLSHLRQDDWVLHIDADIALPDRFRTMLEKAKLNKDFLYGADRLNCYGFEKWVSFRNSCSRQYHHHYLVECAGNQYAGGEMHMGSRVVHPEYGWVPIGFFQLWNASRRIAGLKPRYPFSSGSSEHDDVMFSCQWPREERVLIPDLLVYHLESERAQMGVNWDGRKTVRFGPKPVTQDKSCMYKKTS